MSQDSKGRMARALDWYLNDPVSLAVSSAFCCGSIAFFFGTIVASLFAGKVVTIVVGVTLGLLGGFFGAREQLHKRRPKNDAQGDGENKGDGESKGDGDGKGDKPCCSHDRTMRIFALTAGAGSMACCAGQVLGMSGNLLVVLSLITGAIISTLMVLVLDRSR